MAGIILARHGETDWNVAEVFRGRIDIELNETGVKQAELLGGYLSEVKIGSVYSSPLKRALRTAEIIASHNNLKVNITPGLIDMDFGKWQGLSRPEIESRYKELYTEWVEHPEQIKIPDGESLDEVRARAMAVLEGVIRGYDGTLVLVSHRVVNKVLICALLGLDNSHFWNIKQDTCGITRFNYENGRFILIKHNDNSYLEPVRRAALGDF